MLHGEAPYDFEVWEQPNREGGGCWWPVVDRAEMERNYGDSIVLSGFGARLDY